VGNGVAAGAEFAAADYGGDCELDLTSERLGVVVWYASSSFGFARPLSSYATTGAPIADVGKISSENLAGERSKSWAEPSSGRVEGGTGDDVATP
jgi:hypothetical protein